jgi:3-deoxy-7-phosphoheptulonate synthase / chorismate mutase
VTDDLAGLRSCIDEVDARIVAAVNERLELVERLWRLKGELGVDRFDPAREQEIRSALRASSSGPLTTDGLDELITELLALTKREHSRLAQGGDPPSGAPPR